MSQAIVSDSGVITLIRGDTLELEVVILDSRDIKYLPSEYDRIIFIAKKYLNSPDVIIEKELDPQEMFLRIEAEETAALKAGNYPYNIKLIFDDNTVCTVLEGVLKIKEGVNHG